MFCDCFSANLVCLTIDETCYLELYRQRMSILFTIYSVKKMNGNITKLGMNEFGKKFIIKNFEEKFRKLHIWDMFKNKVDVSRKTNVRFKKMANNRTGLVYDIMGRLEMLDVWWGRRIVLTNFF